MPPATCSRYVKSPTQSTRNPTPTRAQPRSRGHPRSARMPDHQRSEEQVSHRVGQVRGDRRGTAGGRLEHGLEDDGRAERGEAQPGDDPVQPHAPGPARAAPCQPCQPGVAAGIQRQPQQVADRRDRRGGHMLEPQRPQQVSGPVEGDAGAEHDPRPAQLADAYHAQRHDRRDDHVDRRGGPVADRLRDAIAAQPERRMRAGRRDDRREGGERGAQRAALEGAELVGEPAHPFESTPQAVYLNRSDSRLSRVDFGPSAYPVRARGRLGDGR